MIKFKSLKISKELVIQLGNHGILNPTKVQVKTIPLIYEQRDLIVQSMTGSGKTLSFAIPLIDQIRTVNKIKALIIAPTRELAKQIAEVFKLFSTHKELRTAVIYGGVSMDRQINHLRRAQIVVATPGRLLDLINRKKVNLTYCQTLVIDEVDQLLDMGFIEDVRKIIKHLPTKHQSLMFSATADKRVSRVADKFLTNPKQVFLKDKISPKLISQEYYHVNHSQKIGLLTHLIKEQAQGRVLVFCNTKVSTRYVTSFLNKNNLNADSLNGDMTQSARERVLKSFADGDLGVLVATDVAARGIHVDDIHLVFNVDVPRTIEAYTHRIGRTARQGKKGVAITIVTDKTYRKFKDINQANKNLITKQETPFIPDFKVPTNKRQRHSKKKTPKKVRGRNKRSKRKNNKRR